MIQVVWATTCCIIAGLLVRGSASAGPFTRIDPSTVLSSEFPVPPDLRGTVLFWQDIFVRHGSDAIVVHDRDAMDVVWGVVDLPRNVNGSVDELQVPRVVAKKVEDVRKVLRHAEQGTLTETDTAETLVVLQGHRVFALEGAWLRVRSQRGQADKFLHGVERFRHWQTDIYGVLARENVPVELAALPFIESMFTPQARSSAGAKGIWQLMPATARQFGLRVTVERDERVDVLKATRAAARMLRKNYELLGSWPLAITGYNHGPYGVLRAVRAVGSNDIVRLIQEFERETWGFSSKNFYAEFLAATMVLALLS